jgi:phosphoribosylaminoimidazolecarboxamide formyltransferase/IMP cyclohydrolase
MKIQRALISVSDKTGLVEFARELAKLKVEIISTGGTAKMLADNGVPVMQISDFTGFPEMLDGRVKTLHPKVHGGLLHLRDNPEHVKQVQAHGIQPIDLVVVNLYPFEQTVAKPGVKRHEAIENIDIGGPSMLRSAAKNHEAVTVIVDPADYAPVADELKQNGDTSLATRQRLAQKVFQRTAAYDAAISTYLASTLPSVQSSTLSSAFSLTLPKAQDLRYGENPHQRAALYGDFHKHFQQLHGKELSFNNILDISAAANLIAEFDADPPTVAILKHTNPCGLGSGDSLRAAWDKAFETDKQAPFGGIIVVNRAVDLPIAEAIAEIFSEVIIAPDFASDAMGLLKQKKNLRLIRHSTNYQLPITNYDLRSAAGNSLLVQDRDTKRIGESDLKIVTKRQPTKDELRAMLFGWRVVKHVKSNAIVYAAADRTLGIGAGQMSRVDSSRIAVWKAKEAGLSLKGSIIASDAFFPFPDGLIAAADAGATAAIQPGGSLKDAEVITAANQRGMAMAFTNIRHFRH